MKNFSSIADVTRDCAGATPAAGSIAASRRFGLPEGARSSALAVYAQPAAGVSSGKHAPKRTTMALINTTGWPMGPQDRLSG